MAKEDKCFISTWKTD